MEIKTQIMGKLNIEVLPSLAEALGMESTSEEGIADGVDFSVQELLDRLCARYPRFGEMVFDWRRQELTGQVVIFLNGRHLDLIEGLKTELKDGDTLTFIPYIEGG